MEPKTALRTDRRIRALEREKARGILAGLYAPRWRRQMTRLELDRFEWLVLARGLSDDS